MVTPIYENAIQAAYDVVLGIIESGIDGLDGHTVGKCTNCDKSYIKKHGNSKLCEQCKPPTARSKAFRDRTKVKEGKVVKQYGEKSE